MDYFRLLEGEGRQVRPRKRAMEGCRMFSIIPSSAGTFRIVERAAGLDRLHAAQRSIPVTENVDLSDSSVGFDAGTANVGPARLAEIRAQIAAGTYLTNHKLDVVAGILCADLRDR